MVSWRCEFSVVLALRQLAITNQLEGTTLIRMLLQETATLPKKGLCWVSMDIMNLQTFEFNKHPQL